MSLIAGHVKIAVGADMTDFLKDVERGVKNTPVANEGKNNRDREAAARKQADREGDIAGKARSDADHARSSREREKHLGDELSRIRRDASTEGDLFGRTFAKAWSKDIQRTRSAKRRARASMSRGSSPTT